MVDVIVIGMAGGIHRMETLAERARKCVKCNHEWVKQDGLPEPKRCPNHACRSQLWRGDPKAGESIALREDFGA